MYIGTAGGRKQVVGPVVGTATGNKPINKVWVGTSGGNKLVWQRWTSTTTLTASVATTKQINLSWTASPGATYQLFRTQGHTTGPLTGVTSALSFSDTGLAEGTTYNYRLDVHFEGKVQAQATASATTGVTPPPTIVQRYWESAAAGSASFNGNGTKRTDTTDLYHGYYSGNHGVQKSQFWFNIPADIRNCVSIDRIDIAVWGVHTFPNGGTDVDLAVCHAANNSGSTAPLRHNGADWPFRNPKGGWMGTWVTPSGWNEGIQVLSSLNRPTVAEEFRVNGAVGFTLLARTTAQSGYGYATGAGGGNYPRMRCWYTVQV